MKREKNWRRLAGRLLTMVLSLLLVFSFVGSIADFDAFAAAGDTTTRGEWLSTLVDTFEMTVEENNMPDDYFPDVTPENEYYEAVMKAAEFGVIDIPAGYEVHPEAALTREFAAHTLAYCLGYEDDGETPFTFTDVDAVEDDYAAQIAIDRGWFAPASGAFVPDSEVTGDEISSMIADAKALIGKTEIDPNYNNQFTFAEGVVEIPNGTDVVVNDDETQVIISGTKYADQLTAGTFFAVYRNEFPVGYKVISTSTESGDTVVAVEAAFDQDILIDANAEGIVEGDLGEFVPADDVEMDVVLEEEEPQTSKLFSPKKLSGERKVKAINLSKTLNVAPGIKYTPKFTIDNIVIKYKTRFLTYAYAGVEANVTVEEKLDVDALEALGFDNTINLGYMPVAGVGYVKVDAVFSLKGSITSTTVYRLDAAVEKEAGSPTRKIISFKKQSYHLTAKADGKVGVRVTAGFDMVKVLTGSIYAEGGAKGSFLMDKYDSGLPVVCTTLKAWMYATYGYRLSAFAGKMDLGSGDFDYYNFNNSPVRLAWHWEDGKLVPSCARHPGDPWYYTQYDSQYGSISGGWGLDGYGNVVPVYTFEVFENEKAEKEAKITGYTGYAYYLDIPETVSDDDGEYPVTIIGGGAFENRKDINYVKIPDSVTKIEGYAFYNCSLQELVIPDTVTEIGVAAFAFNTSLTDLTLSKTLTKVGGAAFGRCDSLTSVEIPKSITETTDCYVNSIINGYAYGVFMKCPNLSNVTFEEGIETIPNGILANTDGLTSIAIPDTVTAINSAAFEQCKNLETVTFSKNLRLIDSYAFNNCVSIKKLVIPDTVTEIGVASFAFNTSLTDLTLSKSLTKVGGAAFGRCDSLTSVEIPKSITETTNVYVNSIINGYANGVFMKCPNLTDVTFEEGITTIPNGILANTDGLTSITIPDTVTAINSAAFEQCKNLETVTFGKNLTLIDSYAFNNCVSIKKLVIPDTVTEIGVAAFAFNLSLTDLTLSKSLTKVGGAAFGRCDELESVEIPKSITETTDCYVNSIINGYANGVFMKCPNLTDVTFEEGITTIPNGILANTDGLKSITIPDTVTAINGSAFEYCKGLETVTFSKNLTLIGSYAFYNCASLEKLVIPDSVVEIGGAAFALNSSLKEVTLSQNLSSIHGDAFGKCDELETITIPKSLKKISDCYANGVFAGYTNGIFANGQGPKKVIFEEGTETILNGILCHSKGLTEVVIPDSVTKIQAYAFEDCPELNNVVIPDSVKTMEHSVFIGDSSLSKVTYSSQMTSVPASTFKNCTSLTELNLPNIINTIDESAFEGSGLLAIDIPDAVTYIGNKAFNNCASLKTVNFNSELQTIDRSAFENCVALTGTTLPESLTSIGIYAFRNCDALTGIVIPNKVNSLGNYAFADSTALKTVVIGGGITELPEGVFSSDESLSSVTLPLTLTKIGAKVFMNDTALNEIYIPRSVTSIDSTAFSYYSRLKIYGVKDTTAETFAKAQGATFIEVSKPAEDVSLDKELTLAKGKTAKLNLVVTPADTTDEIVWASTDESVAKVSDNGTVTAVASGTATIKVYVGDDLTASCKVTVVTPVTKISVTSAISIESLESYTLKPSITPSNATDKTITFTSSDETVASVTETGVVTGHKKGEAVITVAAQDGSGVTANCTVTVTNNVVIATDPVQLESEHRYANNCTDVWIYTVEGAESLNVSFDEQTDLEEDFDYLYIYDGSGNEVGRYTGTALAGQTINVTGDTIKLQLNTNAKGTAWGFKVTNVEKPEGPAPCEHEFTAWQDGKDGTHFRECTKCGEKESEAHTLSAWTSKNDDVHARTCDKCGYEETEEHAWTFDSVISEPTLTEEGRELYVCTVCEAEQYGYTDAASTGWCGDDVYYSFDPETGVLTISGSGEMYNYNDGESPFCGQEAISVVVIEEGVTSIGNNAFQGDADIESLSLPSTLESIGSGALAGCSPSNVTYAGSAEDFAKIDMADDAKAVIDNAEIEWTDPGDEKTDISDFSCILEYSKVTYDSVEYCPAVTVEDLVQGTDFNVIYENNRNAGTAKVTVVGIGDYTGSIVKTFVIEPANIANAGLTLSQTSYEYTGQAITPKPTSGALKEGVDFELSYKNNTNAGTATVTATGKGNYTGTWSADFTINDGSSSTTTDLNTLDFAQLDDFTFTGAEIEPCNYNVKLSSGTALRNNADYTVEYRDNVNAGTATAVLTGKGKYSGTAELYFSIMPIDLSGYKELFGLTTSTYVYDGKVKAPKLKYNADNDVDMVVPVEPGTDDYTIQYSTGRKNVGKYNAKFTFKGNYKGTLTYSFMINPKATAWKGLTAVSKGFTAKWAKRTTQTTGYHIQYSTSSTFKTYQNVWIKKTSTVSKKVTKLKARKKYYVRIRTYKTVNGTKYYSAWTTKRSVTTKK